MSIQSLLSELKLNCKKIFLAMREYRPCFKLLRPSLPSDLLSVVMFQPVMSSIAGPTPKKIPSKLSDVIYDGIKNEKYGKVVHRDRENTVVQENHSPSCGDS